MDQRRNGCLEKEGIYFLHLIPCMKLLLRIFFLVIFIPGTAFSQTLQHSKDSVDIYDMSLEQLLTLKAHGVPSELEQLINQLILAASKRPMTARESPGIVTLITEEEIRNSGARDLIDVLRLVPGIDFGADVEGVVGVGTRGLWAHEGKMLLLFDGQEMNDLLFATNQFGNHFAVDQIKKIEVIRGPGSAIYGGFAEYGVINIITRDASDLRGVQADATFGQMKDGGARRNLSLSAGKKTGDFLLTMNAFAGTSVRSDRNYTDLYDSSYSMNDFSELRPLNLNAGIAYKGFHAMWMLDNYQTLTRDSYDRSESVAYPLDFRSQFLDARYALVLGEQKNLVITPRFNMKTQTPWQTISTDTLIENYSKKTRRILGNVTASYNLTRRINFVAGTEMYNDAAKDQTDSSFFSNGEKEVQYTNTAVFFQGLAKTRLVNLILGARFDHHSEYGSAFVPRVGITKKFHRMHFKALYNNSFRAPSIENINLQDSSGTLPEYTQVMELEAGYQLTRSSLITGNFFNIITRDPIVYFYDDSLQTDNYMNSGGSGSRGIELEYRLRNRYGYLILNYSNYSVSGKDRIDDYSVPDNETMLLAFPTHKANLNVSLKAGKYFRINPTFSFIGERYGYTSLDSNGTSVVQKFPNLLLANLFVSAEGFAEGLFIGLGCYDILDSKYDFIQPYNGYHAPIPGPSRELVIKVSYRIRSRESKRSE